MYTKHKFTMLLLMLLIGTLPACSHSPKFEAPEIEPPVDLIPSYVPEGFELGSGYQIPAESLFPAISGGDDISQFGRIRGFDLKSPKGNDILGVYYTDGDHLILISKSYFPQGTLDLWLAAYHGSELESCECNKGDLRLTFQLSPVPFDEIQEERTIDGTRIAILKAPLGWITVFARRDYLITVESGISLEQHLKIVASLLKN